MGAFSMTKCPIFKSWHSRTLSTLKVTEGSRQSEGLRQNRFYFSPKLRSVIKFLKMTQLMHHDIVAQTGG